MQIGMIGLGRMGASMATRLLRGGHDCVVHDQSPQAVHSLVALGATALGLLAVAGPAWAVRPAAAHAQRGPARGARRVRGPPQPV